MKVKDILYIICCTLGVLVPDLFLHPHFFGGTWLMGICYSFGFYLSIVILIYGIICLARRFSNIYNALKVLFAIVIAIYAISSIFLITTFDLRWNTTVFQLIHETTRQESTEFLKVFLLNPSNLGLIGVLVLIWLFFRKGLSSKVKDILNQEVFSKYKSNVIKSLFYTPLAIIIFLFLTQLKGFGLDVYKNHGNVNYWMRHTEIWNVYQGWLYYQLSFEENRLLAESQSDLRLTDSCTFDSSNIILIIGESFNRHHSSLYGYDKETNPKLSQKSNLVIYDDVIAPDNTTLCNFQDFLSMASTDDSIQWWKTPLFPAFFKKVGYNVIFWSNQYTLTGGTDVYDAEASFFNGPAMHPYLFSRMNNQKFSYDMELVEDYVQHRKELENDSLNFIIFHLLGQHSDYQHRYPKEEEFFVSSDYDDRLHIDNNAKKTIANYDNATRYNDLVVNRIIDLFRDKDAIILYMADHGEEIYDFRNKFGRHYDFVKTGEPIAHCLLDIPFLFYMSDRYRENHVDIASRVDSCLHLPFMTDDLPHLMLGLAGIRTAYYQPERDLLNPAYNTERKRKINRKNLFYEEVCSSTANGIELSWID